jgi:5'-methylthioadenosine phosphorylase
MPGEFVVPDQLIDQTWGRLDTFYDSDDVQHLSFSDPYCPRLRASALAALDGLGEHFHPTGTTVVIPGPRFSTRAESRRFREQGAHLVNMTQYPEAALAAELNIGLVNLSFVTDLDAGDTIDEAVDPAIVLRRMVAAAPRLRAAVAAIVAAVPADYASRELVPRESVLAVLAARPAGS